MANVPTAHNLSLYLDAPCSRSTIAAHCVALDYFGDDLILDLAAAVGGLRRVRLIIDCSEPETDNPPSIPPVLLSPVLATDTGAIGALIPKGGCMIPCRIPRLLVLLYTRLGGTDPSLPKERWLC